MNAPALLIISIFITVTIIYSPLSKADDRIPVKYWQSKDKQAVLLAFPTKKETYYFDNDSSRLCFSYKVKGIWRPSGTRGLIWSERRHAVLGVLLYNEQELKKFRGNNLLEQAANLQAYILYRHSGIHPQTSIRPFATAYPNSFKWTARWNTRLKGEKVIAVAIKYFVVLNSGWLIQVTAGHQAGGDTTARAVIDNLRTTKQPGCFWPRIRKFTSERRH